MKFSEQWLREWINPDITSGELSTQLTMAGLEVDTVVLAAPMFHGVVVGEVVECGRHPDADKLSLCQVNIGGGESTQIVCGAANVRAGLKVAVATVGARLPGDFKIKKAKLRGVESHGMICAARELGLADNSEGIMELRADAQVGTDLREYLSLDDHIIDIELTPNRGDCAGMWGIAREMGVVNRMPINEPDMSAVAKTIDDTFPVKMMASDACPRYVSRVMRGVNSTAVIPLWMEERLRRSGIRSIHPVVDVCNYVMIELGQPMHAFDLAKLDTEIQVRHAKLGEKITTLDNEEVNLHPEILVIADAKSPQAIAGVMGADDSAVSETTQDIFLESAFFSPNGIRKTAKRYSMQTDSSYRFERGVDYKLQVSAIERATRLLQEITGGEPGPVIEMASEEDLPRVLPFQLRYAQIERLLGITLDKQEVEQIFTALGLKLKGTKDGWEVEVPSYRFDLAIEVDFIEEIARIHGYDAIPECSMRALLTIPSISEAEVPRKRIANLLIDRGYSEAITYSFVDPKLQAMLIPDASMIELANPIAPDLSVMRVSHWPSLVKAVMYNQNRQATRVRLFETGLCFHADGDQWQQTPKLGLAAFGDAYTTQWSVKQRELDYFDVKNDIEALLALTNQADSFQWREGTHPALHPGQSADLYQNDICAGHLGALHPSIAQQLDLNHVLYLFEVSLNAIGSFAIPEYREVSKFPAVRRDLALVLDQVVTSAEITRVVEKSCGQLLNNVQIFDIYQGEGIESGKKSVAMGLTFQDPSRTLVDSEINDVIQDVVTTLEHEFNAKLRA